MIPFCNALHDHVSYVDVLDAKGVLCYIVGMYISVVPNRSSPPAVLLRESRRQGGKSVKKTIANLSKCPPEAVEVFRLALKGVQLVPKGELYATERSIPHGHVQAILGMICKLGVHTMLASRRCRERDLVVAMIAQRLLNPCSKLATTRYWHTSTLAAELDLRDADENDLYGALDWLLARQKRIEKKLARRHLSEGAHVLFDVSSSSYHGRKCPLAAYGHNRDGEKLPAIVYGLLADAKGRPIAIDVYAGNTGDPTTVPDQVEKLRNRFGLKRVVLVGDRGMLTQTQIKTLQSYPGLGWISALRAAGIRKLVEQGSLQLSVFDKHNLAEIKSDLYPDERLIVCYNPLLAEDRRRKRMQLLEATEKKLHRIATEVKRRTLTPLSADQIGVKVGKVVYTQKMAKHFILMIGDGRFEFERDLKKIEEEQRLDGIYIIRTGEAAERLSAEDAVRTYKSLGQVEQAFRCLKGVDLRIRPIRHRTEDHVRAHIFLSMLAYYVEWYMRKALAPILFEDEELDEQRWSRDPVAKAHPSQSVRRKKQEKTDPNGWPIQDFASLLDNLATRCRNTCRTGEGRTVLRFEQLT